MTEPIDRYEALARIQKEIDEREKQITYAPGEDWQLGYIRGMYHAQTIVRMMEKGT